MILYRWILLRIRNFSGNGCRENQNTQCMFNNCWFFKIMPLWANVERYGRSRQATDDNTVLCRKKCSWHAGKLQQENRHTLITFNTYGFYMAIMVMQTHFSATLHIHWLPCKLLILWNFSIICMEICYTANFLDQNWSLSSGLLIPKHILIHNNYFHCD